MLEHTFASGTAGLASARAARDASFTKLLLRGAGSRVFVDPARRFNPYGCAASPESALQLGSCTGSSISERGLLAAQKTHAFLQRSSDMRGAADEACERIREGLRRVLQLPPEVATALAPSGTDAELLALALAAGSGARRVVNIVVGPSETGSGTTLAARGCHFDSCLPSGNHARVGEAIDADLTGRVEVVGVGLRASDGSLLDVADVDAAVSAHVSKAFADGATVLLHVVSHSKTGLHAPSLDCVTSLRRRYPDLSVVVDAAQGRFSRRELSTVLGRGFAVLLTGSKFFGGPAFSGALLVPPNFSPAERGLVSLPRGFEDYFTAADMPRSWKRIRQDLPATANYGLILRWSAALSEMQAYYETCISARAQVLSLFEREAWQLLESPMLSLVPTTLPGQDVARERVLQSKTSVLTFRVHSHNSPHDLEVAQLRELHRQLATDVSAQFRDMKKGVARSTFRIGQPVCVGTQTYGLRVALGAPLIVDVCSNLRLGATLDHRLEWFRERFRGLREKLEALNQRSRFCDRPM